MNSVLTAGQAKAALESYLSPEPQNKIHWERRIFSSISNYAIPIGLISGLAVSILMGYHILKPLNEFSPKYLLLKQWTWGIGGGAIALGTGVIACVAIVMLPIWNIFTSKALAPHYKLLKQLKEMADETVSDSLLKELCELSSDNLFKAQLLQKMSLDQIRQARKHFKVTTFREALRISSSNTGNLQVWKAIDKIISAKKREEVCQDLALLKDFKNRPWYSECLTIIDRELQGTTLYRTIRAELWKLAPHLQTVTIRFENGAFPPLVVKRGSIDRIEKAAVLLIAFDTADVRAIKDEVEVPACLVENATDYQQFKRMLDRFEGKPVKVNLDQIVSDLSYADKWFGEKGLALVEKELEEMDLPDTLGTFTTLAQFYKSNVISPLKGKVMGRLEQLIREGKYTPEERAKIAEEYHLENLLISDKQYYIDKLQTEFDVSALFALYSLCDNEEYAQLFDVAKNNLVDGHLPEMLSFFHPKQKEIKGQFCFTQCVQFARQLDSQEKVKIWGVYGMPDYLLESYK